MGIINSLINRLEKSLEKDLPINRGHVDLSKLTPEDREKAFITFGEGSENLTKLLKTAYEHNVESEFCCSGHGGSNGYVVFKVTDDNLEYLQNVGKALSKYNVVTNFDNHYSSGKRVDFRSHNDVASEWWFGIAADIMENIQDFDYENPTLFYHETMSASYTPLGYRIQEKLLNILKNLESKNKLLPKAKLNDYDKQKSNFDNSLRVDITNNTIITENTEDKKTIIKDDNEKI